MKALLLRKHGGLDDLEVVNDHPMPSATEGHVVIRTKTGFVSDYWTSNRCKYPLVAVYGKFRS